jgi:hypothetical protein
MKIYYVNDEQRDMRVRVMDNMYSPFLGTGDTYVTLQSAEGRLFELEVPAGHIPYVKKWKDLVMISHIDPAAVPRLVPERQRQEDA